MNCNFTIHKALSCKLCVIKSKLMYIRLTTFRPRIILCWNFFQIFCRTKISTIVKTNSYITINYAVCAGN